VDVELVKLNLSDIVSSSCEKSGPLSDKENQSVDVSNETKEPTNGKSVCDISTARPSVDVELVKLNLSDIVSSSCEKSGPLSDKENQSVDVSNQTTEPTQGKSVCDISTARPSDPWENDDILDSELATLNLSDIVSSCCGKSEPLSNQNS